MDGSFPQATCEHWFNFSWTAEMFFSIDCNFSLLDIVSSWKAFSLFSSFWPLTYFSFPSENNDSSREKRENETSVWAGHQMLSKRNHFQAEDLRFFEDLEIFPGRTTSKIKEDVYWLTNFVLFHVVAKLQVKQHQTLNGIVTTCLVNVNRRCTRC